MWKAIGDAMLRESAEREVEWRKRKRMIRKQRFAAWKKRSYARILLYWKDFWFDFFATIREVTNHITLAQICAAGFLLTGTILFNLLVWCLLDLFILAPIIWFAWNHVLEPHLMWMVNPITLWDAFFMGLLGNFILFRSIRFELHKSDGDA